MQHTRGFTLVELLVVISILGLLTVALLPQINGIMGRGDETATQARIQLLRGMIEKYSDAEGDFPPSLFSRAEKGVKVKPDSTNAGIECLLIHLHQKSYGKNFSLSDKADWLGNTDEDDNGDLIPELATTKKLEVLDAWLNPIVYFHNNAYGKSQEVVLHGEDGLGETVTVTAMKGAQSYVSPRKYQLISAGQDQVFGTNDDVCYPARPKDEE